ncbi:hypothetical protein GGR42_002072 [Saonia flava]|uniref:DinB family protein n=1 Tax=Saonia flava TaxID=523696 RepID=A0A846QXE5_9FLAO|nr:hypothetical protein [Saonia flava]NJB71610.1 hypothetical protein [Saonia flava]
MKKITLLIALLSLIQVTYSQTPENMDLPYREIPDGYSETYTAGTVSARMLDGVGFRFYWATNGLRPEDLSFKPNDEARTTEQTIDHILGLVRVVNNSVNQRPNINGTEYPSLDFQGKRKETLELIKEAAEILRTSTSSDFESYKIVFKNDNGQSEFPFWNQLNGPIADALWHIGQVVSFRRSSGNPFASGIDKPSVFTGKVRN